MMCTSLTSPLVPFQFFTYTSLHTDISLTSQCSSMAPIIYRCWYTLLDTLQHTPSFKTSRTKLLFFVISLTVRYTQSFLHALLLVTQEVYLRHCWQVLDTIYPLQAAPCAMARNKQKHGCLPSEGLLSLLSLVHLVQSFLFWALATMSTQQSTKHLLSMCTLPHLKVPGKSLTFLPGTSSSTILWHSHTTVPSTTLLLFILLSHLNIKINVIIH